MKKLLFILIICSSLQIANSQSGWFQINSPTNNYIYSTYFFNKDTGFIGVDSGRIYKTMNGGLNWNFINVFTTERMWQILFINSFTGYILTGFSLFKSSNGGLNWIEINIPYPLQLVQMFFLNINTGYLANISNILRTRDGGMTWDTLGVEHTLPPDFISFYSVYFKNSQTGFAIGNDQLPNAFYNGVIWITFNGGQNWSRVNTLSGTSYSNLSFINNNVGYCIGSGGYISKTIDGGSFWFVVNLSESANLASLFIINESKVFTCGAYGLYQTNNGGLSWPMVQIPNNAYHSVFFTDSLVGYVVGDLGHIYKTTTGGNPTDIQKLSNGVPEQFSLSQNYPNPFNPVTKIKFSLPNPSEGGAINVKLIIYDILGREVTTLVNEALKPGSYEAEWDGSNFASGIYFYSLQTEDPSTGSGQRFTQTKKMVLMK